MCGIIGYLGNNAEQQLIGPLKQLQNRGYDSAGISLVLTNKYYIKKYATTLEHDSIEMLENNIYPESINGIGHTRWATHGSKTKENSHPHISHNHIISIVHNGIIENYMELKEFLLDLKYTFSSETDSEVISNLLEYFYLQDQDMLVAIKKLNNTLKGTWGLCIQNVCEPTILYATRNGSPILIGHTSKYAMISSEDCGFCSKVNTYFELKSKDICKIEYTDNIQITTNEYYEKIKNNQEFQEFLPEPFKHWTLKEIHEQPNVVERVTNYGSRYNNEGKIKLGGLDKHKNLLYNINHLILLGCGTSYYSSCIGVKFMKKWGYFDTVQVFDAGDFSKHDIPKNGKVVFIFVSQSGETKDLYNCIELLENYIKIGVINKVDSLIAREVDFGCYLNAGREVGVASTKSFTSQVIMLSMIALWFNQLENGNQLYHKKIINQLKLLPEQINSVLKNDILKEYPRYIKNDCFILGKDYDEYVAKEGSLKMKELTYVHCEGYSSSSLKHGPYALIDKDFPVILISPDDHNWNKNENIYNELKSRQANIITITTKEIKRNNTIIVPTNSVYQCLINTIVIQIISYYTSVQRNINPDKPKNLAKVVTVD